MASRSTQLIARTREAVARAEALSGRITPRRRNFSFIIAFKRTISGRLMAEHRLFSSAKLERAIKEVRIK
jgi:hypothetical protein